jgi:hypothetical protein
MLPARLWPTLDAHLPVSESALPAALLTVLAGAAIGIPGFFEYASEQASMSTDAMLEAARVQAARPAGEDSVTTSMPVAMTALSVRVPPAHVQGLVDDVPDGDRSLPPPRRDG